MKKHLFKGFGEAFRNSGGRFETEPFDPGEQYAVIRASICTGEKVAGFRNKKDGSFTEVMMIRTPEDERKFKEMYKIDTLKTEY